MPDALAGLGEETRALVSVLVALAIGFLIGLERGWRQRDAQPGDRQAGIRTFAMLGLFGGLIGIAPGDWALPAGLLAAGALIAAGYYAALRVPGADRGMTSEAAALVTVALGGLAGQGAVLVAAIGGVLTVLLLGAKRPLHTFLGLIQHDEIAAAVKLLAISVLVLPLLPNVDYGPGGVLNPYGIWWAVVLVATLSFAGYVAIRVFGATRGPLLFGLVGGLASSTAVTVTSARLAGKTPALAAPFTGAIALASAVMMVRVGVYLWLIAPALLAGIWPALAAGAAASAAGGLLAALRRQGAPPADLKMEPPQDYWFAVTFGLVLAGISLAVVYAERWFGDAGLYAIAALSGPFDVDAFSLSVARGAGSTVGIDAAGNAILLGVAVNTAGKAAIAWTLGGATIGARTAIISGLAIAAGFAAWLAL